VENHHPPVPIVKLQLHLLPSDFIDALKSLLSLSVSSWLGNLLSGTSLGVLELSIVSKLHDSKLFVRHLY